jgi:hypothetical protein
MSLKTDKEIYKNTNFIVNYYINKNINYYMNHRLWSYSVKNHEISHKTCFLTVIYAKLWHFQGIIIEIRV